VSKDNDGVLKCQPIKSRIVSLFAEQNDLQYAVPGGLIGQFIHLLYFHTNTSVFISRWDGT